VPRPVRHFWREAYGTCVPRILGPLSRERPHQSLENGPITVPKKRGRPKTKQGKVEDENVPLADVRIAEALLLQSRLSRV